MEAELTALEIASTEAEWLRELLMDLPMVEKLIPAILINCDNQTVITKVKNSQAKVCQEIEELRSNSCGIYPDS